MQDEQFSWNDGEDVVVPEQLAIAAYENRAGNIVILQRAGSMEDQDSMVIVSKANLPKLIAKLKSLQKN